MKKMLLIAAAFGIMTGAYAKKVKFQVDMSGQTVSGNGIHAAGNFQSEAGAPGDWDPSTTSLSNGGSGNIYYAYFDLPVGLYEYKYVNGSTWNDDEKSIPAVSQVGSSANGGANSNRWFEVFDNNGDTLELPAVTFNGGAPAGMYAIRFSVDLQKEASVAPDGVLIAGDFTSWGGGQKRMTNLFPANNKVYEYIAYLAAGTYSYKFKNGDGGWESVPSSCANGGGNREVVPSADAVLAKQCFASCGACPTAPLPRYFASFIVDMSNSDCDGGFDSVTVTGARTEITNWGAGIKLTKMGATQFYVTVLEMDSGSFNFKFRMHKNGGTTWEGGSNREWNLSASDTMDITCFGERVACTPKPAPQNITFVVDLSEEIPDAQGRIYVMGTFQAPIWQGGALRMSPMPNKVGFYSVTVPNVCPGVFDYKFVNGDSSLSANEESFADTTQRACVTSNGLGGFNRSYTRTTANDVTIAYVYNTCTVADLNSLTKIAGKLNNVKVYPNPTTTVINVDFNDGAKSHEIFVTDIAGKLVAQYNNLAGTKYTFNKSDLGNGMFFVTIRNNEGNSKTVKVIVQ